jgi:hypothetical protein
MNYDNITFKITKVEPTGYFHKPIMGKREAEFRVEVDAYVDGKYDLGWSYNDWVVFTESQLKNTKELRKQFMKSYLKLKKKNQDEAYGKALAKEHKGKTI